MENTHAVVIFLALPSTIVKALVFNDVFFSLTNVIVKFAKRVQVWIIVEDVVTCR
jgi:hypothetical protein